MAQRTVFNREQYESKARELGVFYHGTVCATVEDGVVLSTRRENRNRVYKALGWDDLVKEDTPKAAPKKTTKTSSKKTTSSKKKSAPKDGDRLSALESRMDSVESKLDAILAKLG